MENIKDPNSIVSTGNVVKAYRSGESVQPDDMKKMRDKAIEKFWGKGKKSPKQKKADKDKEIEDIINKKKGK